MTLDDNTPRSTTCQRQHQTPTEFATGGELFDRLVTKGAHSEHDAASLLREVVHAVAYLHGHSIIHFDIKPENILVSKPDSQTQQ